MNACAGPNACALVLAACTCIALGGCTGTSTPAPSDAPKSHPLSIATAAANAPPAGSRPAAAPVESEKTAAEPVGASSDAIASAEPATSTPSAACLATTSDANVPTSASIHRWVDAAGVTHYSDQAPTSKVSDYRVLEVHGLPPVKVEASGYDVDLPGDLERRAIVDAVAVQHVFHDVLGIDGPSGSVLKIVFVQDPAAYARLVGDRELAASSGAYVPPQHTIYVRMQNDDELAFQVLRHEITHALIHERVGDLPVVLNEGLAEYFRRYHAAGMGGQVDLSADRTRLVEAAPGGDGSEALVDLMALDGRDFYATDRDRRYLRAYALVALLMRDAAGTAALHEVLARQHGDPCKPVDAAAILDERYPGGLSALAAGWVAFLRDPPASVRAY